MSLNERIAKGKGLNIDSFKRKLYCALVHQDYIPQYTKDLKLIHELVLELMDAGWVPFKFSSSMYGWAKKYHLFKKIPNVRDEDFGIATAMAYCEEKGL